MNFMNFGKTPYLKSIIALSLTFLTACVDSTSSSQDLEQTTSSDSPQSQVAQSSAKASSSLTLLSSSSTAEMKENEHARLIFQSDEHIVAGQATIQSSETGLEIQFHSDFIIDGGPDVFIFLSDNNYEDVETGSPQGEFFKIEQQIAVQNVSTKGEMLYTIEGLSLEEAQKFKSIHFYCEMFGFIHWGGASIEWK